MNEQIAIRLYEHPEKEADRHAGPYKPTDAKGWGYDVGDTVGLLDDFGGYEQGTIESIDPTIHANEDDGQRYKVAVVILED